MGRFLGPLLSPKNGGYSTQRRKGQGKGAETGSSVLFIRLGYLWIVYSMARKVMVRHRYKRPGLLRAGFQYQDLIAIEILIDFYRQRDLYDWVQLEAEDRDFWSVEDVVARRPDGLYELTQVKFTADPEASANSLSWTWLTERNGARKSLLQKWAPTTLHHQAAGTLARAALKTDRIPDASFEQCLKGTKIDYALVPTADKAVIEKQLGSPQDAQTFFASFDFDHSLPRLDDLEERLWARIASDTDRGGWLAFRERVQRWSTLKGQPAPDGKIKYIHLRQAFSVERSRPLPQGFLVPSSYSVPDDDFHRAFVAEITGSDGFTVLWGSPGRGKSTYLSHCVAQIVRKKPDRQKPVCIRHHYFLSLTDRSEGRFHYHAITQSLEHQLTEAIPALAESHQGFGELLEVAALRLQNEDRRLIVIIDGLDHVWRDHRDHEDMEALFKALLPLPANVRLVVGTQKIASEHLPKSLLSAFPMERWTELPTMSQSAVLRWLRFQDKAGRLNIDLAPRQTRSQGVRTIASALYDVSQGLPLHLIYSFEALVLTGGAVTAEIVSALPACPTGDIRDYYRSLWERIGPKSRTILHVLAGLEFGPPPSAMHECFGRSDATLAAFAEINHLLDRREIEVRPFHGSLFAFVRDLPDHDSTFAAHAADVLTWLETRAPEYWHWAWLWIIKAQLGDPAALLARPSREWAINSLVSGYPVEQLVTILYHAEQAAFNAFDLPRFLVLRSLKTRALNGPEFQTREWPLFLEVAVSLSEDPHVGTLLRTELRRAPAELFPFLVRSADTSIRNSQVQSAINELYQQIVRRHDDETVGANQYEELAGSIVAVVANADPAETHRVVRFAKQYTNTYSLIASYAQASLLAGKFDNVFEVGTRWSGPQLDRDVLAALCFEGLTPAAKPDLKALTHPALRCLALLKGCAPKRSRTKKDLSRLFVESDYVQSGLVHEIRQSLYETFFAALAAGLSRRKAQEWSHIPAEAQTTWLSEAVRALERVAGGIAEGWRESRRWPTLQDVYGALELEQPTSGSHDERRHFTGVRFAFQDIAIDLCTIVTGLDPNRLIDASDIQSAATSPFWLSASWLEAFSERRLPLHSPDAARAIVERINCDLDTTITEFSERADTTVKLALFACDHGLVALARKELGRAVGCLLGYGSHKDMFAFEVLESLDMLAKNGDSEARKTLLALAGEFEAIIAYTDGDETGYAREEYYEAIATHFPDRVAACYASLIRNEEWRCAEALATAMAGTDHVESRAGQALLETYIVPSEVSALEKISSAVRPHTEAALATVRRRIGRVAEVSSEQTATTPTGDSNSLPGDATSEKDELPVPAPSDFPPGHLREYLSALHNVSDYDARRRLVIEWLRYWETAGHADEALSDLEAAIAETRRSSDLDDALDEAFETALRTQGRSKAFPWLIRAQVSGSGWQRWYTSSERAQARMRAAAQHYPERWREFVKKTAKPVFAIGTERNGISIGLARLVYLLVEVGEMDLAQTYALEMARIFKEELTEQPIKTPEWSR